MQVDELPYIDEHAVEVAADADDVWSALLELDHSFSAGVAGFYARMVGCVDGVAFRVDRSVPTSELVLAGRHRFSTYAVIFRVDEAGAGRTRLTVESRAAFPGRGGRAYRALVIGTRGHVLLTRRLLAGIKRAAEDQEPA